MTDLAKVQKKKRKINVAGYLFRQFLDFFWHMQLKNVLKVKKQMEKLFQELFTVHCFLFR